MSGLVTWWQARVRRSSETAQDAAQTAQQRAAARDANIQLLGIDAQIREYELWRRIARRRQRLVVLFCMLGPALLLGMYALFWFPAIRSSIFVPVVIPGCVIAIVFCVLVVIFVRDPGGGPKEVPKDERKSGLGQPRLRRRSEGEIELLIAKERDSRKSKILEGSFGQQDRRLFIKMKPIVTLRSFETIVSNTAMLTTYFKAYLSLARSVPPRRPVLPREVGRFAGWC